MLSNQLMFDNLLGQDKAIELLTQAVKQERVAPAYLFSGSSGIGRSIAAKSFAKLLLTSDISPEKYSLVEKKLATGNHPDLLWVEPTYLSKGELYTASKARDKGLQYKTPPKIRIEQIRNITQFLNRPVLEASRKVVVIEEAQTMAEAPANALIKNSGRTWKCYSSFDCSRCRFFVNYFSISMSAYSIL